MKRVIYACLIAILLSSCAQLATAQLAWPQFHRDYMGSGQGAYGETSSELSWVFFAGSPIRSGPVIGSGGIIYFTCDDGKLYAVSGGGEKLWDYLCNCVHNLSPAVGADGTIYVASADGFIYAVNPDGTRKWRMGSVSTPTSSIAIGPNGNLYFARGSGIQSMTSRGALSTFYSACGATTSSTPAIDCDGNVYFGASDYKLYAYSPSGGLPKWTFPTNGKLSSSPAIASDGGTIFIGSDGGKIYAIYNNGNLRWSTSAGGSVASSAAVFSGGYVFWGARDGKMHGAAIANPGSTQWSVSTGGYVDSSPAVGVDGSVYVGSNDGKIYSFSQTGELRWTYSTGGAVYSSPAIGPAGALVVGSLDGHLYCFSADSTPPGAPVVTDDGVYTSYTDRLHGSWTASDPESGIYQYEYCIGTAPGLEDVAPWLNVNGQAQHSRLGLKLVDKAVYYITVRAINGAGIAGPSASSDGIIVDASPATTPAVTDGGHYTSIAEALGASWSSQDPESGIAGYSFSIGSSPGATDVVAWTDAGLAALVTKTGLSLSNGATYYFNVKAKNGGGVFSQVGSSDGITVDVTQPLPPNVRDTGLFIADPHAISVTWSALDPESGVAKYEYSVGTQPGAADVLLWANAGTAGGKNITGLNLINGGTYYVNVRATNGAGLVSDIGSSDGAMLDSTVPDRPIVTDDGALTGLTNQIHASWSASDSESGIKAFKIAIGTTPGGTDALTWSDVGALTDYTQGNLTLSHGQTYYVSVIAVNNAMAESPVGTSDGIKVDATAPTTPLVTDDGDVIFDHTQLHASWVSEDPESGMARYEYSIGTSAGATDIADWTDAGSNTSVTRTGLALLDLSRYYFNVRAYNTLGGVSEVGSSDGILVDSQVTPAPTVTDDGQFTSSTTTLHATWSSVTSPSGVGSYEYSIGTAAEATDIKAWTNMGMAMEATAADLTLAQGETYYINVRALSSKGRPGLIGVSDGITVDTTAPTKPTVTDGGVYTTSSSQLTASWSASDLESGIAEYKIAVGTTPGAIDALNWTSVGTDTSRTMTGLALTDTKTYYISVKAKNAAGLESLVGSSDGIIVDLTPPVKPTVTDDGAYTVVTNQLHAAWSTSDPQSGVVKYEYSIGKSAGAADVVGWTDSAGKTDMTITGLSLQAATRYYINVRATNGAGLVSQAGSSDGIYVETTPPTKPVVTDGGAYTKSTTTLTASWTASDLESGITKYEYSIGTSAGGINVVGWTNVNTSTSMNRPDLSLIHGQSYYINVRATNAAGLVSQVGSSDGIRVDTTPPLAPTVTDAGKYTSDTTKLTVTVSCSDAESGVASYEYAVGTAPSGTDVKNWTQDGAGPSITITGLSLTNGAVYYISARATNGAGLVGPSATTDGITVDITPPANITVTDDGDFMASSTSIHGSWSASDPESGIAKYKYCVGSAPGLSDTAGWLDAGSATEQARTGLSLISGKTYYISVIAVNGAGGESAAVSSNGIKVDITPPSAPVVTDAGRYWGFKTSLAASWTSADAESGIIDYQFSIGTSAGAADVAPWQSVSAITSYTRTGLMLKDGITYYINIKAKNGAGAWSAVGSSDGIMIDSTPPATPVVVDDGDTTSMLDRLHCTWHSADPESGIAEYMYCIGTSPGAVDVVGWTSAGINEDIMVTNLQLDPVLRYYFSVKARSNSGAWSAVSASDGIGFSSGAAIWARFRGDSANKGRALFKATTVAVTAWSVATQGYVESSPAIAADGTTYIGSGDGKLYAITQNGTVRWTYDTGSCIDSSPAITPDGNIVFGCSSGKVYCLNSGGESIWQFSTNDEVRSSPLVANGLVYVGSMDGSLYAISLANGTKVWSYATGGGIWSSPAIDSSGVIYIASEDRYLYAIKPDGTKKWEFVTGSSIDASPAIASDGTVYIGSGDGYLYAVKPDGTKKWQEDLGAVINSSVALGPDGTIYLASGFDGSDGAIQARKPDGSVIWSYNLPMGGTSSSPAIDPDGRIYVGSSDGYLYALNSDGSLCFNFKTQSSVVCSPAIGADSSVVFGSDDGGIYCLRDVTSKDLTPPTTPAVTVPGPYLKIANPLVASWSAADPESMVAEYTYAIGTTPGGSDVAGWTSAGIETSTSRDDLLLELGKTYYVSVKARNPAQRWSAVGVSHGVMIVAEETVNRIGSLKKLPADSAISVTGKIITGVFSDCFFIEEPDRSAGIRCSGAPGSLRIGDVVDVTGSTGMANGEKIVKNPTIAVTGNIQPLAPLGIAGRASSSVGLDPTGLYVTVWGNVSSVQSGYFVLDGEFGLRTSGMNGIGVQAPGETVTIGALIAVKGVLCRELLGGIETNALRVISAEGVSSLE